MKYVFICTISAIIILSFFLWSNLNKNHYFLSMACEFAKTVSFYTSTYQKVDDAECIKNGVSGIINCSPNLALKTYENLIDVVGMSFYLEGDDITINEICRNFDIKIITKEWIGNGITSYLGFSSKLSHSINIDNQKINIQVAHNKNKITVGVPLILGSY